MVLGRVYKICAPGVDECYVGSTILTLTTRLSIHRSDMKRWLAGKRRLYMTSFQVLAHENATIEQLEVVEFEDKSILHQREAYWITELTAVNKWKPPGTGLSKHEYRRRYHSTHSAQTRARLAAKVTCPICGLSLRQDCLKKHIRRKH